MALSVTNEKKFDIRPLVINDLRKKYENSSKKRQECFAGIRKSSTFASAFEKEARFKKSSLKDLR